jgi:hypothetical protein
MKRWMVLNYPRMLVNSRKERKKAQEGHIQRPKFGERKEILQVPPLWWCESYCKEV